MRDYLNLKVEQLLTQTEQLIDENEKLRDITYELEQNLLAAEDQNHYFQLMSQYRDKSCELEQELRKKSNMLAKVKRYFGISVRKNSEMQQELQKTREQLEIAEAVLSVQCTDSALAYFKDKQGE